MPDQEHAHVAESYAKKEEERGKLSKADENRVDRKAARVLGEGHHEPLNHGAGGAAKSKSVSHGGHKNVVNPHSHHEKLRHC